MPLIFLLALVAPKLEKFIEGYALMDSAELWNRRKGPDRMYYRSGTGRLLALCGAEAGEAYRRVRFDG